MIQPHMAKRNIQWCAALDDPALWALIDEVGSVRQINAGTPLIRAGDIAKHSYIICKGLLRHFYHSPDGRERNKNFFREGQIAGSINSLLTGGPCPYNLETLEDSEIIVFPNFPVQQPGGVPHCIQRMFDITLKEMFLRNESREAILLTKSGEERYRWVLEQQSWLVERLPQYHLASYLGLDAVSLSRIKAKLAKASR